MRIISGSVRGRKLKSPKDELTRPTADRLKETLFNILAPLISGSQFLDVFAGSGSIGLEAVSRGASFATFMELQSSAARLIQENIRLCGFEEQTQVLRGDALRILKSYRPSEKIDLIFMDPPYQSDLAAKALQAVSEISWVKPETILIIEHHNQELLPEQEGFWQRYRQVIQGEHVLSFYRYIQEGDVIS